MEQRYSPEGAARSGVTGLDDKVTILSADRTSRRRQDMRDAKKELETRLAAETDPLVRQDLQIAAAEVRLSDEMKTVSPYLNPWVPFTQARIWTIRSPPSAVPAL